jgi:acyl-CoA dehydrogenase
MAVIREHLAAKGLGLFNDLQNEHSVVGNFPIVVMLRDFGTRRRRPSSSPAAGPPYRITFGLTEPDHGSDATHMDTTAVRETRDGVAGWRIDGARRCGPPACTWPRTARCSRAPAARRRCAKGITCFLVPADTPGVKIEEYLWTFNMPTDHPRVSFTDVWVPETRCSARWAAAWRWRRPSCTRTASARPPARWVRRTSACRERALRARAQALRPGAGAQPGHPVPAGGTGHAVRDAAPADPQDRLGDGPDAAPEVEKQLSDKVSMCNYWANRLVCEAADRAMQVHGGIGYSRHKPFEHIYRHHRRYRITEGSRRSRCARWRATCSATWGRTSP